MGRRRRRGGRGHAVGALPEAIAALSQTLPAGPSPEIFRRAKFDRPEAAPALWQLLSRVLAPPPAAAGRASPALGAQVRLVKSALCSQGYPRRVLAQLPEDGSQGSRELLLALAWLLARGPLLEHVLAQTRVWLGDEIPLCQCEALAGPGPPAPCQAADGPVDVRHLQWLMGKLRFRWRDLITSQQEQCALLGKIHSYTRGCHSDRSLGHLSVAETELLRDPEGGRQVSGGGAGGSLGQCTRRACTLGTGPRSFRSDLRLLREARRAADQLGKHAAGSQEAPHLCLPEGAVPVASAGCRLHRGVVAGRSLRLPAASEAGERERAPGGRPGVAASGAGFLAVDGHGPGQLPPGGLTGHVSAQGPRVGAWRVGAGGPGAAGPA
ncbi:tubulin epsilon and delta complex protein 1 isoform X4 [Meles meles]|uniref:tubulin epsilon and delta complex protein 1 isoform X4 n=1 Tax=Meles meles TaxID=9662 RepID=UPI001E699944|nr:tubulin epsilon and delta complex protein 1 isoform X4 [Meles meles]